jgi:hypothetical protein
VPDWCFQEHKQIASHPVEEKNASENAKEKGFESLPTTKIAVA